MSSFHYRPISYLEKSFTKCQAKGGCGIRILKRIRPFVGLEHLINVYRSIVEPYFTYCCIVWDSIGETLVDSLQKLQNRAARVITGANFHTQNIQLIFCMNLGGSHLVK